LEEIKAGEPDLVLAHRPFPTAQFLRRAGADRLARQPMRAAHGKRKRAAHVPEARGLIRGYSANDRIIYGTGRIVTPTLLGETAHHTFRDPRVRYMHVRSARSRGVGARGPARAVVFLRSAAQYRSGQRS